MKPISAHSDCPVCGRTVPATLVERDGDVTMRKDCPEHGAAEAFFWRDAQLYEQSAALSPKELLPPGRLDLARGDADGFVTTFAIDVTTRCNLDCPTCVTAAGPAAAADPPVADVLSWIPDYSRRRGFRPNISLIGGESALRDDLPEIIRGVIAKGLVPRLNSNGLLLRDAARLAALREAGLRWVILQFDGLSPAASLAFRGCDLTAEKREALAALAAAGFTVHLAVMVQKGVNDGELGDILRFAAAQPVVRRVSFYPRSEIGRFAGPDRDSTYVADLLAAIERGTAGRIAARDILDAKHLWRALFRATRRAVFRPRPCIFPFVVMRRGGELTPVTRLLRPRGALADPGGVWRLLREIPRLARVDDAAFAPEFLFVNIEKFYDRAAFDLDQARNCRHVYLTADGAYPFCIYNTLHRPQSA